MFLQIRCSSQPTVVEITSTTSFRFCFQSMHCQRSAFHSNGHNRGDPPCVCGPSSYSIFQPRPNTHRTTARDAHCLLTEVWHESGMVPKVSVFKIHTHKKSVYNRFTKMTLKMIKYVFKRCLQDNEWDFNRAAAIFTQLKVTIHTNFSFILRNDGQAKP